MNAPERTVLALDAHGGDHGPGVTVPAALDALADDSGLSILLCGEPGAIEAVLAASGGAGHERVELLPARSVLPPDVGPKAALREGERSSAGAALAAVAQGRASACVSAGNTGALMTLGIKLLGMVPGIRRPALMSQIPSEGGATSLLDLGANLNVDAEQLVQFAVMGAVVCAARQGDRPSVGLLNVGREDGKGHAVVREAHATLRDSTLNYVGFIEGHDIYAGSVDVAVCDGFAGNLILKASEGLAAMLFGQVRASLAGAGLRARLGGWLAAPALRGLLERLDPGKHNGAPLLGLNGVVVKSHGGAGRFATGQAIREAGREARRNVPARIGRMIQENEAKS